MVFRRNRRFRPYRRPVRRFRRYLARRRPVFRRNTRFRRYKRRMPKALTQVVYKRSNDNANTFTAIAANNETSNACNIVWNTFSADDINFIQDNVDKFKILWATWKFTFTPVATKGGGADAYYQIHNMVYMYVWYDQDASEHNISEAEIKSYPGVRRYTIDMTRKRVITIKFRPKLLQDVFTGQLLTCQTKRPCPWVNVSDTNLEGFILYGPKYMIINKGDQTANVNIDKTWTWIYKPARSTYNEPTQAMQELQQSEVIESKPEESTVIPVQ